MSTMPDVERAAADEVDRAIAVLDSARRGFPEDDLRALQRHREQAIPKLTAALRTATAVARAGVKVAGDAHFYALFLLAEFRAREALPAIIEAISLPGEMPFDLFGDAITETLPGVLAALVDDVRPELDDLIKNFAINSYVRWSAADAVVLLVRDGLVTREAAAQFLCDHLQTAIDQGDVDAVTSLVISLCNLGAKAAEHTIAHAFELGLVERQMIDARHVDKMLADPDAEFHEAMARCRATGISDTVAELSSWNHEPDEPPVDLDAISAMVRAQDEFLPADDYYEPVQQPFVSDSPRIGRNDPCPCGSGKKFKKCCGGPRAMPR